MYRSRPIVLLTGFGPFPGTPENASQRLMPELAAAATRLYPEARFEAHVLPTEWVAAPCHVADLYDALQPAAAIHFGVSSRARGFEIETRGVNRRAKVKDAAGELPASDCVAEWGPAVVAARLPVGLILARLRRRCIPVLASRDAGSYLCNALLYTSAALAARRPGRVRAGFVHLPAMLDARARRRSTRLGARLDWEQAMAGALEIVGATLRAPGPTG